MALNLSIIKSPTGVSLSSTQKSFSEQGGTIGRGDGNDWVLSDPDRFLSSRHCGLSFESGQYYLTDMSTNGTFINGAPEPLGKGGKIPLNDGDTIEVGDYQFRAELQPDLGDIPLPADPFGQASVDSNSADNIPDPFTAPDPFEAPISQPVVSDPFGSDPFSGSGDVSLNPDPLEVDPLAALDNAGSPKGVSQPDSGLVDNDTDHLFSSNSSVIPDNTDFLSQPERETHSDGADALNQAVSWPDAQNENLIPEDWDDDLLRDSPSKSSSPRVKAPPVREEHRSMPLTDPPMRRRPGRPRPPEPEPLLAERKPDRAEAFSPASPKAKAPTKKTPQHSARPSVAKAAGDALLEGLGLADKKLSAEEIAELHAAIGELMPVIITGMMQVLRSRASIKNEFRMNVTTIQPIENNPLKFSADATEAIENMFVRRSSAYMEAKEAFQQGFDGIGEHQVAIIAGIRAAFKSMMDRFNPELLERQFDRQNKGVVLPGMQKTKYWNSYIDYYNSFVDNMENTFQFLFGDEFVQAYEDQLRRLAVERKKRQKLD